MPHLCLLHWSLSSQLHFPVFPFPKTRLHVLFSSCSSPACFCPLLPGPLSSPSGSSYPPSRSLFLSPWASVPFFPVVYVPPPISVPPSLGLCPHPSGSLFTPYLCFSLFLRLPQHPSLPAHLSLCTLVFPVSASTPPFCQSLPFNLLPKPHWEVRGRGNTQGKSVKVFLFGGKAVGLGGGPGLDSDFDTKLTHLKPHVSFIWKH